jgi:hypothetical protein
VSAPENVDQLKIIFDAVGIDPKLTDMVASVALAEFRRGYLYGLRDMKQRAENAIGGIRVETE